MIKICNISKSFGSLKVLRDISMEVTAGEVVVIIGPSGSGKSTLLRCINYLEKTDAGLIYIDGQPIGKVWKNGRWQPAKAEDIYRLRRQIGMVFQRFNLFPHRTALENVMEGPLTVLKNPRKKPWRKE
jgi:polar amino acid transport system ATP-binding protein